jgi:hypothetical protein
MIFDFAIEPELVASWGNIQDYRYFAAAFGIGQPRILAEYPKFYDWRLRVLQAAQNSSDMEKQRVTALIGILSECRVNRKDSYDCSIAWLQNAEHVHRRSPFHAILATENPNNHRAVLTGRSLGNMPDDRWNLGRSSSPDRQAADLADCVENMLRICNDVVFVDPHFGPENRRHRKVLEAMLQRISARGVETQLPKRIELQTSDKACEQWFRTECDKQLPGLIPEGMTVTFRQLRERIGGEKLHNRYILTDIGGVSFQVGLDEGKLGETEDIDLMDRAKFLKRWSQYAGNEPVFDTIGDPITIVGIAARRKAR